MDDDLTEKLADTFGDRLLELGASYSAVASSFLDRTASGLRNARSGSYGPSDWFRDFAQTFSEVAHFWVSAIEILTADSSPETFEVRAGEKRVTQPCRIRVRDGVELDAERHAFQNPLDEARNDILFIPVLSRDRKYVIIHIPEVPEELRGFLCHGTVRAADNSVLLRIAISIK